MRTGILNITTTFLLTALTLGGVSTMLPAVQAGEIALDKNEQGEQAVETAINATLEQEKEKEIEILLRDGISAGPEQMRQAPAAAPGQEEDPYADQYPGIAKETRIFWHQLSPVENKRDTTAIHNIFQELAKHMSPNLQLISLQDYRAIPFDDLSAEMASEVRPVLLTTGNSV